MAMIGVPRRSQYDRYDEDLIARMVDKGYTRQQAIESITTRPTTRTKEEAQERARQSVVRAIDESHGQVYRPGQEPNPAAAMVRPAAAPITPTPATAPVQRELTDPRTGSYIRWQENPAAAMATAAPKGGTITLSPDQAKMMGDPGLAGNAVPLDWWGKQMKLIRAESAAKATGQPQTVQIGGGYTFTPPTSGRGFNAGAHGGYLSTTVMPPKPETYQGMKAGTMGPPTPAAFSSAKAWGPANPAAAMTPAVAGKAAAPRAPTAEEIQAITEQFMGMSGTTKAKTIRGLRQQYKDVDLMQVPAYRKLYSDASGKDKDYLATIDLDMDSAKEKYTEHAKELSKRREQAQKIEVEEQKAIRELNIWDTIRQKLDATGAAKYPLNGVEYDRSSVEEWIRQSREKLDQIGKRKTSAWQAAEAADSKARDARKAMEDARAKKRRWYTGETAPANSGENAGLVGAAEVAAQPGVAPAGVSAGTKAPQADAAGAGAPVADPMAQQQQQQTFEQVMSALSKADDWDTARKVLAETPGGTLTDQQRYAIHAYMQQRGW